MFDFWRRAITWNCLRIIFEPALDKWCHKVAPPFGTKFYATQDGLGLYETQDDTGLYTTQDSV